MGSKTSLRLCNSVGIIDSGYRGEIMAFVDNISDKSVSISAGERYFQLCAANLGPVNCQVVDKLNTTERNSQGFGSTGK